MKTSKSKRESGAASAAGASAGKTTPAKASAAGSVSRKAVQKAAKAKPAPSVVLASHCSVKDAAGLKSTLLHCVGERAAVAIDIRSLERVDTATMQLLCAFVRDRKAQEKTVEWLGESAALHEAARLLGVGALLELPDQTGGAAA